MEINVNENDQIQNLVECCADELFKELTDTKLCIVHFLCGTMDTSGAIRKSSLRTKNSLFSTLVGKCKLAGNKKLINIKHRDVLRDYIRYLDRRNTFLRVIEMIFTEKMGKNGTLNKLVIQIKIDTTLLPHRFDSDEETSSDNCLTVIWKCGTDIPKTLIPSNAVQYLEDHYLPPQPGAEEVDWPLCFEIARSETFGRILHESEQQEKTYNKEEKNTLSKNLAALQAAMLYLEQCKRARGKEMLMGTAILIKLGKKERKDELLAFGVVILSPCIEDIQIVKVENIVRKFLCGAKKIVFPSVVIKTEHIEPRFAGNTKREENKQRNNFKKRVEGIFKLPVQKQQAKFIGLWLLYLTERLQNSVHEGDLLDFFFVAGDKSDFRDHPLITFKDFKNSMLRDLNSLAVPKKMSERDEEAPKIILTKEHFPWFQGGRNALFYDVSGNSLHPLGLVAIKGSSWAYIVADRHYDRQSVKIPNCVTIFTTASPKGAGAIMTTGEKVEEIAKLKNSQWNVIGDDREKNLIDQLKNHLKIEESEWLNEIAKLAILVADNPRTGGTILISKQELENVFPEMGKAWAFENLSLEDRIALIAHDGATARNIADTGWKHRLLLLPDEVCSDVKKEIVEYSQNLGNKFPLSCVGSRRWSAAIAAFHPKVEAVIVISQDGDILCWASKCKSELDETLCLKLPQSGKALWYDFKNKKWTDKDIDSNSKK